MFAGFRQELSDLHIPYTVEGGATLWSGAEKLKLYGFDNTSLKLMVNYMSCRKQNTVVNGHVSTQAPVTSILGQFWVLNLYIVSK